MMMMMGNRRRCDLAPTAFAVETSSPLMHYTHIHLIELHREGTASIATYGWSSGYISGTSVIPNLVYPARISQEKDRVMQLTDCVK